jgi:hypothetical protein
MTRFFSSLRQLRPPLRWFRKAPSGSVLILVVALIVILALLGTAFVATARLDRYTAGAGASTVINDQLNSLQNEICNDIANGLIDQNNTNPNTNYRPVANDPAIPAAVAPTPTYGHFDSNRWYPGSTLPPVAPADPNEWDTWLADRLPTTYTDSGGNINITWRTITRLPSRVTSTSNLITPTGTTAVIYNPWGYYPPLPAIVPVPLPPTMSLIPTAIAMTYPRSTSENPPNTPKVYPAFIPISVAAATGTATYGTPFLAADADGDGIADSVLFPLNVTSSSSNGTITYFAAVRIVDNNSAVNLNTAWSRFSDFKAPTAPANTNTPGSIANPSPLTFADALGNPSASTTWIGFAGAGAANLGWLPSHVGLLEMLDPNESQLQYQEMARLNSIRFGTSSGGISSSVYDDGAAPVARTDYQFLTLGDALWNQLGRRIQNPGYNGIAAIFGNPPGHYEAVNDNGTLAFGFNLIDPSANLNPFTSSAVTVAQSAPTTPELELNFSLYIDAINFTQFPTYNRWSVYPADKAVYWFDYNFNNGSNAAADLTNSETRDNEAGAASTLPANFYRNLRAVAVTRNPVSNAAPIHSFYGVTAAPAPLNNLLGRQVPVPPPPPLTLGTTPPVPVASFMDVYPTSPKIPIRASINTDSFGTLWRAFWNVMCDDLNPGPNAAGATGLPSDHTLSAVGTPYTAVSQIYTPPVNIAALGTTPLIAPIAPATMRWPQYDQLLIRAAIAAVNAEGLRDLQSRNDVISRCIVLPDGVTVEVFSNKLQPYIMAYDKTGAADPGHQPTITLGNPTSSTINMTGWVLAYYAAGNASTGPVTTATAPQMLAVTGMPTSIGPGAIATINITLTGPNATIIPMAPADTDQVLLMRPRLSSGTPITSGLNPTDSFNEKPVGNGYWDYVPIDYVVYNQSFASRGNPAVTTPNWSNVQALLAPPGSQPMASVNTAPNQIFSDDFAGPYATQTLSNTSLLTSAFPFGAFARVGDILKVPFIGSYRVIVPPSVINGTDLEVGLTTQVTTPQPFLPVGTASVYFVPISMDAAACYTGTLGEQVGHFCPVSNDPVANASTVHDYDWAKRLFDYFTTIQNPGNDFSPNVNPGVNNFGAGVTANWSSTLYNSAPPAWPSQTINTSTANGSIVGVTSIANTSGATANVGEENVGVDGLININTAPWQVLASLPMLPKGLDNDHNGVEDNIDLAKAIVLWRDGDASHKPHGPFKSIFDLNSVTDGVPSKTFQNGWGSLSPTFTATSISGFDSDATNGDFSPAPPLNTPPGALPTDGVPADFEKRFLMLTRISNLITTRSDTFTCYVVVQGWLNAGTNTPTLVSQQRIAFIANRVAVGPGNTTVQTTTLSAPP